MSYYERNLPHWLPEGKHLFLSARLHGFLPVAFLQKLRQDDKTGNRSGGKLSSDLTANWIER